MMTTKRDRRGCIAVFAVAGLLTCGLGPQVAEAGGCAQATRAADTQGLTDRFAAADRVSVTVCYRRVGKGRQRLVRFGTNRVSLVAGRGGRVVLRGSRRGLRLKRVHGRGKNGWQRVNLRMNRTRGRVLVRAGRQVRGLRVRLKRETTVSIGDAGRGHGGPYVFGKVSIEPSGRSLAPTPGSADRLFAPASIWNAPLAADAPLDPDSSLMAGALARKAREESRLGIGPWIATDQYSTPIYKVPASQRTVRVALDDPTATWRLSLQAAFERVPIPANAKPARGTDGHMTIWQPATDKLWEFWKARKGADGVWRAAFGGAIERVSQSPGHYTTASWPGARPYWGASATSLPLAAGTMTIDELRRGRIDHALAVALPFPRQGVYALPAQRTDGTSKDPSSIPEGAQLRINPKLDLSKVPMPRMTRMIAEAAQRHGMVVRDRTGHAMQFYAEDPTPTGTKPYFGPAGFFQGKWPADFLSKFPWEHVQVLEMKLRNRQAY